MSECAGDGEGGEHNGGEERRRADLAHARRAQGDERRSRLPPGYQQGLWRERGARAAGRGRGTLFLLLYCSAALLLCFSAPLLSYTNLSSILTCFFASLLSWCFRLLL